MKKMMLIFLCVGMFLCATPQVTFAESVHSQVTGVLTNETVTTPSEGHEEEPFHASKILPSTGEGKGTLLLVAGFVTLLVGAIWLIRNRREKNHED